MRSEECVRDDDEYPRGCGQAGRGKKQGQMCLGESSSLRRNLCKTSLYPLSSSWGMLVIIRMSWSWPRSTQMRHKQGRKAERLRSICSSMPWSGKNQARLSFSYNHTAPRPSGACPSAGWRAWRAQLPLDFPLLAIVASSPSHHQAHHHPHNHTTGRPQ